MGPTAGPVPGPLREPAARPTSVTDRAPSRVRFAGSVQTAHHALALKRFPYYADVESEREPALEALRAPAAARRDLATDWMAKARLVVVPYADTPFIESMVMGAPTVGLWDPELWELRDDARPAFDALERSE